VLEREGTASVLQWNGAKKLATLKELIALLRSEGIETEDELRVWLESPQTSCRLQTINGIGDKTAHYLQILVGIQGIAVDRHLQGFLAEAGVPCRTYDEAGQVLDDTAKLLGVAPSDLDYSIWKYMSARQSQPQKGFCACQ
jgi:thermostable 8-oxoguanine DNA glycosylase